MCSVWHLVSSRHGMHHPSGPPAATVYSPTPRTISRTTTNPLHAACDITSWPQPYHVDTPRQRRGHSPPPVLRPSHLSTAPTLAAVPPPDTRHPLLLTTTRNTSFIGSAGPNCSTSVPLPAPALSSTTGQHPPNRLRVDANAASLIRLVPPSGTHWPVGSDPSLSASSAASTSVVESSSPTSSTLSAMSTADVAMGVFVRIAALGVVAWFIRKWAPKHVSR
ncbi:hypothetical protein K438DRAFT_1970897 [Mycena galopus ATCC 62051]|nr:hypothetical protein K438DRAFT_1970897 [Mycena galopus ATCC 62051]